MSRRHRANPITSVAVLATLATLAALLGGTGLLGGTDAVAAAARGDAGTSPVGHAVAQVDPELDGTVAGGGQADVLIVVNPPTTDQATTEQATTDQARTELAARLATDLGARVLDSAEAVVVATVDAAQLDDLRARPEVDRVVPNRMHRVADRPNLVAVDAPAAWPRGTGAGQVVAVVDTGVDADHPALAGRVVAEACFSGGTLRDELGPEGLCPGPGSPTDATGPGAARPCTRESAPGVPRECEHGTHVAAIAVGALGVAPEADLVAVQVFTRISSREHCSGAATCLVAFDSDMLEAMAWVRLQADEHALAAVNLSLGGGLSAGPCDDDVLKPAVDALLDVGVPTVVASGNDGEGDEMAWPACVSSTVSVGAVDGAGKVAGYSNASPGLDLLAPGTEVRSALPGGGEGPKTGTSMAAPHVAGALAVLREARGPLPVPIVEALLRLTGAPIYDARNGSATPLLQVGAAVSNVAPRGQLAVVDVVPSGDGAPPTVHLAGWALDPEVPDPLTVAITVDGATAWSGTAAEHSADAALAHPAHGAGHGVQATVSLPGDGSHRVCLVADDAGPWAGEPVEVSCTWGPSPRFADVAAHHPFLDDVEWAAATGALVGYPDGLFRPAAPISRQAVAAALHRQAGSPTGPLPDGRWPDPGFADVPADHPFHDAIAWAVAEGIAIGYPDGLFRPSSPSSRQAVVAQLHRLVERNASPGGWPDPGFADVPADHPFHDAIAWAAAEGIATGYPDDLFRPGADTSRQAFSAYLHRVAALVDRVAAPADRAGTPATGPAQPSA